MVINMKERAQLKFGTEIKHLYICDMLENIQSEVEVTNNTAVIDVKNFEIVTLMAEM